MNFQQGIAQYTRQAADRMMATIRAMPEDRQVWQVSDTARTVIQQLQECAQAPLWFTEVYRTGRSPFTPERRQADKEERANWEDLDDLERRLRENTEELCQIIENLSDDELEKTVELVPGWTVTYRDVSIFHVRNLWYHVGQVNFIQTLYGDMEMH